MCSSSSGTRPAVIIEPVRERLTYDIVVPITKPALKHDFRKLSNLNVGSFDAIYDQEELAEPFRVSLMLEFATTETEVHQADVAAPLLPSAQELIASITNKVNWVIETKGRVWEGTKIKDAAMKNWCERVSAATGETWRYVRINQTDFDAQKARGLSDLS